MVAKQFFEYLKEQSSFECTLHQEEFLRKVSAYIANATTDEIFILKGYAGTGKTTMISLLVQHLAVIHKKAVLLAPTGRAAKVITNYSGKPAYTIHKHIYYPKKNGGFRLKANKASHTVFIVDESSMIADHSMEWGSTQNSLLEDLIQFVFSGNQCQLIFVGDTAQLPPVGLVESPALNPMYLKSNFPVEVQSVELTEVVRQQEESGILYNATEMRQLLQQETPEFFQFEYEHFSDIIRLIDSYETLDAIQDAYQNQGVEETIFVVRSNKRASLYNQHIRRTILDYDSEIAVGDLLMVVKNNYFWLKDTAKTDFIANGDIIEIRKIFGYNELYGFRFARVEVRLIDFPDIPPFETVIHLETLTSEQAALSSNQMQKLYEEVQLDYPEYSGYKRLKKVKENEFFNALQVKFAYAVTCHKAQGGQWHSVFVEQPYLPEGLSEDSIRWLYTAVTRAQKKVFLIGFQEQYFTEE